MRSKKKNPDKLALLEPRNDGTSLIRGSGFSAALAQFTWVVLDHAGAIVPDEKIPLARQALEAMGYELKDTRTATGTGMLRTARDWPECAAIVGRDPAGAPIECRAPFLEHRDPEPGEHCTSCGQPLVLVYPADRERQADPSRARCPSCRRSVTSTQNFCRCGQMLQDTVMRRDIGQVIRPDLFALPAEEDVTT